MRFQIKTLVDVTNTNARRQDDNIYEYKQQTNFMTLSQTIGLRTNGVDYVVSVEKEDVKQFGTAFKNKQKVWTVEFFVEQQDSLTLDMLKDDFDLVPIISDLDETVKFDKNCFRSKNNEHTNIIFSVLDK